MFREEAGRLAAALFRRLGDFDLAEELVQDALLKALERWPEDGIPDNPGAWLMTAAKRRGIDLLRRDTRLREKLQLMGHEPEPEPAAELDDRLKLLFTCCHPALSREAQVALTLRAVAGFTTPEIARAFLVSEATVAQRIVRARRKIDGARIPFRIPSGRELAERLAEVLAVLYLMFNEGYLSSGPQAADRRDLAEDAAWLTGLVIRLLPGEPEPIGLLSLMWFHMARARARFDPGGELILLRDQDRRLWDQAMIAEAERLLEEAAQRRHPGPYQLQAAIAACHCTAPQWAATDWLQIVLLYQELLRFAPGPVVKLNRAIALWQLRDAPSALAEVDLLARELDGYHLFHATRATLLDELGRVDEASAARARALALTENPAERSLLQKALADQV